MKEWLKDNLISTITLGAIVAAAIWYGKIESLIFPDPETAVRTIDHVKNAKTERELFETLDILDTVADFTKKDSKENLLRDSIRDAEVKKNSVTIYQMKENQERLIKQRQLERRQDSLLMNGILKHLKEHDN